MTLTQLREMSDRDLADHAKKVCRTVLPLRDRLVIEELANRLDDRYPFNPEPTPETEN